MKCKVYMNQWAVRKAVESATPQTMAESGKYVMRVARALVVHKATYHNAAAPGHAPHSHGSKRSQGFKKTIVYATDRRGRSAVIGPQLVRPGMSVVARTHEFGGTRRVKSYVDQKYRDGVKIGDTGPVTFYHAAKTKDQIIRFDEYPDPKTGRRVAWIRIRTKTQAAHSTRLLSRMTKKYGIMKTVRYPMRPFMNPALNLALPKLAGFWYQAVKP